MGAGTALAIVISAGIGYLALSNKQQQQPQQQPRQQPRQPIQPQVRTVVIDKERRRNSPQANKSGRQTAKEFIQNTRQATKDSTLTTSNRSKNTAGKGSKPSPHEKSLPGFEKNSEVGI